MLFFLKATVIDFLAYVFHGIVLKILWGWFMVKTFDLPNLTITQAIGISITIGFMTQTFFPIDHRDSKTITRLFLHKFLNPLMVLAAGGTTRLFM